MPKDKGMNIIDYAKNEMRTFAEYPFNNVDSVILSKLSCVRFNGLVGGVEENRSPVVLSDLLKAEWFVSMTGGIFNEEKVLQLIFALCASPRFRNIKLNYYEENTDKGIHEQFAATTFILPFGKAYLAFRGTDPSLIGWQEDCNMTFMNAVPSQLAALEYIEKVASLIDLPLILGGHSKGGNVAVYGGAKAKERVKHRIEAIYDHDGPGFREEVMKQKCFDDVIPKIRKTVPECSIVGMLLDTRADYRIVASNERYLSQHDTFSWIVDKDDFVYLAHLSKQATAIQTSMKEFLSKVPDKDKERFVESVFQIISAGGADMVQEISEERINNLMAMIGAIKDVTPETRKFLVQTVKLLTTLSVKNLHDINTKKR